MDVDLGTMYHQARLRVAALVDDEVGDTPVPATPAWTVHDVVAHLAGGAHDVMAGNMSGAPGEAWTAAHVRAGAGRSLAELVRAWDEHAASLEAFLSSPQGSAAGALVVDVHAHEADLRHALGEPVDVPPDFLAWAGAVLRMRFAEAVAESALEPVSVDVDDFELFRARLGRRTADEVRAYPWSAAPDPYLDVFFLFDPTEQSIDERR